MPPHIPHTDRDGFDIAELYWPRDFDGKGGNITITHSFGHLDTMPNCEVTGLKAARCSHCENGEVTSASPSVSVSPHESAYSGEGQHDHV